jgi:hypothetical protein
MNREILSSLEWLEGKATSKESGRTLALFNISKIMLFDNQTA